LLQKKQALEEAKITHILSAIEGSVAEDHVKAFSHLLINVDDLIDANLLPSFTTANAFIQEGLDNGGGVLVHW